MKVWGELQRAQLEMLAALPTGADAFKARKVFLTTADGSNLPGEYTHDGTSWVKTGSGSAGSSGSGRNYIVNSDFESNATTNWALFNTTLTSGKPTGSISAGAASVTTFAATATNPLAGSYSLQTASSGAWAAGAGFITDSFTIDRQDLGKILRLTVNFEITSGSTNCNLSGTTSNTFGFWVYDVTNSLWTEMVGTYVMDKVSGALLAEVQLPTTCTSARVAVVCVNASAGAVTINWDNISFGPREIARGSVVTDWIAYTPTVQGFGTVSAVNFISRRVGDSLEVQGTFTAGVSTAVEAEISLGFNGVNANVSSSSSYPTLQAVGRIHQNFSSATYFGENALIEASKTYLTVGIQSSTTNEMAKANGVDVAGTGKIVSVYALVRIQGWSSNVNISSDFGSRLVATKYSTSTTSLTNASTTTVVFTTSVYDKTSSFDGTTFIVPQSGILDIDCALNAANAARSVNGYAVLYAYVDGSIATVLDSRVYETTASTYLQLSGSTSIPVNAGQLVTIRVSNQSGNTSALNGSAPENWVTFSLKQSPQTLVGSEVIKAEAHSATTTVGTTATTLIFATEITDSHGRYDTSTGLFTVNQAGRYRVSSAITFSSSSSSTNQAVSLLAKLNSTNYALQSFIYQITGTSLGGYLHGSKSFDCVAGDTIGIAAIRDANVSSFSVSGGSTACWITVEKLN